MSYATESINRRLTARIAKGEAEVAALKAELRELKELLSRHSLGESLPRNVRRAM